MPSSEEIWGDVQRAFDEMMAGGLMSAEELSDLAQRAADEIEAVERAGTAVSHTPPVPETPPITMSDQLTENILAQEYFEKARYRKPARPISTKLAAGYTHEIVNPADYKKHADILNDYSRFYREGRVPSKPHRPSALSMAEGAVWQAQQEKMWGSPGPHGRYYNRWLQGHDPRKFQLNVIKDVQGEPVGYSFLTSGHQSPLPIDIPGSNASRLNFTPTTYVHYQAVLPTVDPSVNKYLTEHAAATAWANYEGVSFQRLRYRGNRELIVKPWERVGQGLYGESNIILRPVSALEKLRQTNRAAAAAGISESTAMIRSASRGSRSLGRVRNLARLARRIM